MGKDLQGKNAANPTSMILSAVMMLRHLGLETHADQIVSAVKKTLADGKVRTPDMHGKASCTDFTRAVVDNL